MWLNTLTDRNGISGKYYPSKIFTGIYLNLKKHCRLVFGPYVELHGEPTDTKNMNPKPHECVFRIPSVNMKGNHVVFFLDTYRVLKRIKVIPMVEPGRVIIKVKYWCKESKI